MKTKFNYTEEYKKVLAEKLRLKGRKALTASEFYAAWDLGYIGSSFWFRPADQDEKLKRDDEKSGGDLGKEDRTKSIYLLSGSYKMIAEYFNVSSSLVSNIKRGRVGREATKDLERDSLDFGVFKNSADLRIGGKNVSQQGI